MMEDAQPKPCVNLLYIKKEMQDSDYIESDEEVSTNKERHSRLGEDNLDDTLEFDFSCQPLRVEEFKELQKKDSGLFAEPNTSHEVKAKAEEGPDSKQVVESVAQTLLTRSKNHNDPIPSVTSINATDIPEMKDSVESFSDKA